MQYMHFASKLMTAGEANRQIKAALQNKEALAKADLQVKSAIQQSKDKQKKQPAELADYQIIYKVI